MIRNTARTKRLIIRPLKIRDYKAWFDAYTKSPTKKSKYDRGGYPESTCTLKKFKSNLNRYQKMSNTDTTYVWGVFEKKTHELIGILDISIICRGSLQVANLGYRVFNRFWKMGYGKEFVRAGILLGFKNLKLNRLEAVIDPDNKASIRLAKSVGMVNEGLRKKYYYQNKMWADQKIFSAQREDWHLPKLHVSIDN